MSPNRRLGEMLRELRGEESLRALAERAGLDASTVQRTENGARNPHTDTLVALAKVYGISFVVDREGISIWVKRQ